MYAHWTYTGGSGGSGGYVPGYYIIRATAGAGGSITPSGDVSVRAGANQTFTITPNRGYAVSDVKIDGRSIGAVRSYTFENISASHTIEVQFRVRSSFVDVPSGSYYEDAVDWAVANGITTGMDAAHFSPGRHLHPRAGRDFPVACRRKTRARIPHHALYRRSRGQLLL